MLSAPHSRGLRPARPLIALLTLWLCAATPAFAVSTHDLIELSKAGLSDDVLVALIEADNTSFHLDAPKILELRTAGISERVITAMIKSGPAAADAQAAATAPVEQPPSFNDPAPVVVVDQPPPPPQQTVVIIPWGPIIQSPAGHRPLQPTIPAQFRGFGRFINDGWVDRTQRH
jgi:hypothetical protein